MQSGMAAPPPITPGCSPIEARQQHKGELPAPKALEAEFDASVRLQHAESPRSPFGSGSSSSQQQRASPQAASDSDTCSTVCGSAADLAASAAAQDTPQESWEQASHDHKEPILQSNSERFCLLPVK
jgi:hypothetical protein